MEILIIFTILRLWVCLGNNLICNADFETPVLNSTNIGLWFFFFDGTTIRDG